MFKRFVNLLYPPRCPICECIVENQETVCPACAKKILYITAPTCMKCGRPLPHSEQMYCLDCRERERGFDRGVSMFVYDGVIRQSIHRFKYKNRRCYGAYYAKEGVRLCGVMIEQWKPDVILPVPIHKSRRRRRGYNQAEVLAQQLSERLEIPWDSQLLVRVKKTSALKTGTAQERRAWLSRAFTCSRKPEYDTVLLVDDIYTTGTTADVLARLLKACGVRRVFVLTVAIGVRY